MEFGTFSQQTTFLNRIFAHFDKLCAKKEVSILRVIFLFPHQFW